MMRVIYCGDTTLDSAAAYLAGLICHGGHDLTYLPSDQPFEAKMLDGISSQRVVFVFSDYPSTQIEKNAQQSVLDHVAAGAGLVMIGGWESFHGVGGDWDGTPIGDALPVEISSQDDRVNCHQPVLVDALQPQHPITASLPWAKRPPVIGGFNRLTARADSETLLEAVTHSAQKISTEFTISEVERTPLLVVGRHGNGRTVALATDVAPHWVGPLVDWGDDRVSAAVPGREGVEVGKLYATFLEQLLSWAVGER